MNQTVIIVDFGGQYKELIARRVRENGVYSVIKPYDMEPEELKALNPIGIILTGGPNSVYAESAPECKIDFTTTGIPTMGICYGMHYLCHHSGGVVSPCEKSEYGKTQMTFCADSQLFNGLDAVQTVLMSHTDKVTKLPEGFQISACTDQCPVAAYENPERKLYGLQFHPETQSTDNGSVFIRNFLYRVCGATGDYTMDDYIKTQIALARERAGDKGVLLGLSGGVDSSVCAALLSEALGDKLVCIYIDHGFMRKNETEEIKAVFSRRNLRFVHVDARERFLKRLAGVTEPEEKRRLIGDEFIQTFQDEAKKYPEVRFLAQGTIYPDIVESGKNKSAVIKSHHNVGGLPEKMDFEGIIEPLAGLFKDEVRRVGRLLGLPDSLVDRQPFPGPGLSIRIIGDVTEEKLNILREADAIFREEMAKFQSPSDQYFAVLTNTRSVGVMGDFRTYDYTLALRAVITSDFMTCEIARLPYELLVAASTRITNEVRGVNRVVYDITSKPPATIEWE